MSARALRPDLVLMDANLRGNRRDGDHPQAARGCDGGHRCAAVDTITTPPWHPISAEDRPLEEHASHLIRLRPGFNASSGGDA